MAGTSNIVSILWRYQQKEPLTADERKVLQDWIMASPANQQLFDELSNEKQWNAMIQSLQQRDPQPTWELIQDRMEQLDEKRPVRIAAWPRYAAAAAIIGLVLMGTYYYMQHQEIPSNTVVHTDRVAGTEIFPGQNSVVLVGAEGKVVQLDSLAPGAAVGKGTYQVDADGIGSLLYGGGASSAPELYTVQTPKGKQFSLVLEDGTRVWMNATTQLTYPVKFIGPQRVVELVGEAYFEVAPNKAQSFIVRTARSSTEVTGTKFNIKSYKDENQATTTLVEGGVLVHRDGESVKLTPGQQAIAGQQGIQTSNIDTEPVIAWHKAVFWFQDATFETIMKELSRWYPIEVRFAAPVQERFSGILPRDLPLSKLLSLLEKGDMVHFEIKGNTVTVHP